MKKIHYKNLLPHKRLQMRFGKIFKRIARSLRTLFRRFFSRIASFFRRRYLFLRDVFLINVLLFVMILIVGLITFNVHFFDPFRQAFKDFSFSNVYFSRMTDTTRVDTNIILVNTGNLTRNEIAGLITRISSFHPKVIGIDHWFPGRKPGDSLLVKALKNAPEVVGACFLTGFINGSYHSIEKSNRCFPFRNYGFVNYPADDPAYSTIRYTILTYMLAGDTIYSFPAEIIRIYDQQAFQKSKPYFSGYQIINFIGNQQNFITLDKREYADSLADLSIVRNKIVLLGYMGDSLYSKVKLDDIYYTPMNRRIAGRTSPDMYGVVIHANIISMILENRFIFSVPFFYECILSFLITFLHLLFLVSLFRKDHKYFELIAFLVQYISSAILLFLYFVLFEKAGICFNMTLTIIGLISMKVIISLYYSIIRFVNRIIIFKTSLK